MINTCKKRNDFKNLCTEQLETLYKYTDKHGHVPDEEFERHGFPVDLDENGQPVRRPAGISQEHLQRAKNLSHEVQKRLRKERKEENSRKEQNKVVEEKLKILHILEDNSRCEEIVLGLMGEPDGERHILLARANSEHFNNKKCA
jgi:hypothetical protein